MHRTFNFTSFSAVYVQSFLDSDCWRNCQLSWASDYAWPGADNGMPCRNYTCISSNSTRSSLNCGVVRTPMHPYRQILLNTCHNTTTGRQLALACSGHSLKMFNWADVRFTQHASELAGLQGISESGVSATARRQLP